MQARILQSPRWLPLIVWAACMLFTLTVWRVLRAQERKQAEHLVETTLVSAQSRLSTHLDNTILGLSHLATQWERLGDMTREDWESDVRAHMKHKPGLVSMAWMTTTGNLRWLVPEAHRSTFQEHVLVSGGSPARARRDVKAGNPVSLSGGIAAGRDRGFLIVVPIPEGNDQTGSIISVVGVQAFLDTVFKPGERTLAWMEIVEGTTTIYRGGTPPGRDAARWVRSSEIEVPGMKWHLRIQPSDALLAKAFSILPDLVLTVGTLMACLVALTVYLGYTAGLQARELQSLNTELEERVAQRTADLRGANRALRIQTQELARSNDDLQQFAYVASHDLQEPLRMVSSYVQLIQRRYEDKLDEEGNEFMNFAVDGAERMRSLIKDLLAYARLDTGGKEHEPISGDTALRAALKNLELVIEESGAELETAPLPTVLGNQGQLTRLFQNLIGNAIKFKGDRNPLIRISADLVSEQGKQDDELPELIRLSQKDAAGASIWHFTVTDNGIGIDPNFKERIFVIFQRLHGQGQYPGTGIGLAICKKIVQRHGGRIWVESDPGKGSTFHFTLREPPSSPFET